MAREWFCQIAGRQYGPLTIEQLKRMAASGQLPQDAPVRRGQVGDWYYAATMPGIFPAPAAPASQPSANPANNSAAAPATPSTPRRPAAAPRQPANPTAPVAMAPAAIVPVAPSPPAGIPVGTAAIPTGRPVVPQGMPVAAQSPIPLGFSSAPAAVGAGAPRAPTKKSSNRNLIYAFGGIVAVLLVALIVVATRDPKPEVATAKPVAVSSDPVIEAPDENEPAKPVAEKTPASSAKSAPKTTAAATAKTVPPPVSPTEKLLKSITTWKDLAKVTGSKVKTDTLQINVQIVSVWASGAAAATAGEATPAKPQDSRVYVEVAISNLAASAAPLTYQSWNGKAGQGPNVALLADPQYKPAQLVAATKTPDVTRQAAPVRLKPGDSVTDVLVFEGVATDQEFLHLVLPFAALAPGDKPFAFKIPKASILSERPTDAKNVAKAPAAAPPVAGAVAPPPAAVAATEPEPADMPAPAKPPVAATVSKIPPREVDEGEMALKQLQKELEAEKTKAAEEKKKAANATPPDSNEK